MKPFSNSPGVVGDFAWQALSKSLAYSARRVGEICDDVKAIDDGMKWGYNWDLGPFEIWDALGFADTVDRMVKDGIALRTGIGLNRRVGRSAMDDNRVKQILIALLGTPAHLTR